MKSTQYPTNPREQDKQASPFSALLLPAACFLLSGYSALLYQVIWQRILGIFSGMHIYSITMILTAFMAGLGFGSLAGGWIADRLTHHRAVMGFVLCEIAIGLFALISPWLYYDVAYLQLGFLAQIPAAMPIVHLALLIVPTFLMGASLPLLSKSLVERTDGAARIIGTLYGVNTLGAALGAIVSVWFLISYLGFTGTIRFGSALNFLAAGGALLIARGLAKETIKAETHSPKTPTANETTVDPAAPRDFALSTWAALYGLSGFIALSLEILWFRLIDVFIKSSTYAFGHLLGIFLFFLAAGSLFGAAIVHHGKRPAIVFLVGQWGITIAAAVAVHILLWIPAEGLVEYWSSGHRIEIFQIVEAWRQFQSDGGPLPENLVRAFQSYILLPLLLIAPPTFLMGMTYAFIQRTVQTNIQRVGWRVGLIQTSNIVGSILGSFLTGTIFLSLLGTAGTLRLVIVAGSIFGLLAMLRLGGKGRIFAPVLVVISLMLAAGIPGQNEFWARFHGTTPENVMVGEDASSIVTLQRTGPRSAEMRVNGHTHSMLPYWSGHILLGSVPSLLHAAPEEALVIGLGTGNTAWGVGISPTLHTLDVYEIAEPEYHLIRDYENRWFNFSPLDRFLEDPRVNLNFSDGRLALRINDKRYDVIEADALQPSMAYSGNLYSKEFFELCLEKLKPGGIVVTYVPTERVRHTAIAAFPYALEFYMPHMPHFIIGSLEPFPFDQEAALGRLHGTEVQAYIGSGYASPNRITKIIEGFLQRVTVTSIGPHNRDEILAESDGFNQDLFPRDEYDKGYTGSYQPPE